MTRCSIIIPAYNQAALTRQCLEAVRRTCDAEIVLVDDGSTEAMPDCSVRHETNTGFAIACNDGAAAAHGEFLIFLNNDTVPQPGWLDALVRYADAHPAAAMFGAKLVYPSRTIQHAGVVICQDRTPRHIYRGFPADHPAVNKSRRFQIVTAACALVRRNLFDGFDPAFRNGLEDVDLCLRLGARGHEVHYCHESVVVHLESASDGRFKYEGQNIALYRQRWADRVQPDDVRYYLEDGVLELEYDGSFPRLEGVDPRGRQVEELLRENTRLRVELAKHHPDTYDALRQRIRDEVQRVLPAGATALVISKGDGALLELDGRTGWHFPQAESGGYAGHHPADSAAAIAQLESLRARGAGYLVMPEGSLWWRDHYREFAQHLDTKYRVAANRDCCVIYDLRGKS